MHGNLAIDGKFFTSGGARFPVRGVSYGTFQPRDDGARFPNRSRIKTDMAAMNEAGFTVLRTYVAPPEDVLELAADWDLRVLAGVFYPDWRYLLGTSRREGRSLLRDARDEVRRTTRELAGNEQIMALSLGNEIPADVIRWVGADRITAAIAELVEVVREEDPERLVTYANYPTTEYLQLPSLDFLMFNVFLERRADLRRYLTRLHHLAGDRPLVLGEIGLDAGSTPQGEQRQAEAIDEMLETAVERGVAGTCLFSWTDEWWVGDAEVTGWHFGLTRADRSPRPALDVAALWNRRTVRDLPFDWPSISVVICAHNAEATLAECLDHTSRLDYPDLEVIVVDDGSTDSTSAIAARYPRVRLLSIDWQGLSVARNEGYRNARGQIIAYLDSDAYPSPEWPWFLALGFDGRTVGGVGGPNVPPPGGSIEARCVARSPGGPVHVLLSDDRAEHIPGCNMAFWAKVLDEVGGFDPVYRAAGDDVDLCWRVLDRDWEIGFHPAALVWHHRRTSLRSYLRQQRGYGRAEALVERRHPERFTAIGTARWRGTIYDSITRPLRRQRIYRGAFGAAEFQAGYDTGGHVDALVHQVGVPVAVIGLFTAPLTWVEPMLGATALIAALALLAVFIVDAWRAHPPRELSSARRSLRFRLGVATMHLSQPLARTLGRVWAQRRQLAGPAHGPEPLPMPLARLGGRVSLYALDRPRPEFASAAVARLHARGYRVSSGTGWESYDARIRGSWLIAGEMITSQHPHGYVQLRMRCRARLGPVAAHAVVLAATALVDPVLAAVVAATGVGLLCVGLWRTGPGIRRALHGSARELRRLRRETPVHRRVIPFEHAEMGS
jgi:glycosyltransferase involved in cell wall biosynthesis